MQTFSAGQAYAELLSLGQRVCLQEWRVVEVISGFAKHQSAANSLGLLQTEQLCRGLASGQTCTTVASVCGPEALNGLDACEGSAWLRGTWSGADKSLPPELKTPRHIRRLRLDTTSWPARTSLIR